MARGIIVLLQSFEHNKRKREIKRGWRTGIMRSAV
jgi:hypothetical protein